MDRSPASMHAVTEPHSEDHEPAMSQHVASGNDSDNESVAIDFADVDSDDNENDLHDGLPPHCDDLPTESTTTGGVLSLVSKALASDVSNVTAAVTTRPSEVDTGAATINRAATACCVCGEPPLYRCPGCERRTCSITCVRAHKADFRCSGERDVAKKVPLSSFTDQQLQRDFHFLEECRRTVANAERSFPHTWRYSFKALPPPLYALRTAAKKRGVLCQITSEGMQKRDANTSRYDRKVDTIIWRCEFRFHRHLPSLKASGGHTEASALPDPEFTVSTDWASERYRLGDALAYCWATNPPLPSYPINRRYNRAVRSAPDPAATKTNALIEAPTTDAIPDAAVNEETVERQETAVRTEQCASVSGTEASVTLPTPREGESAASAVSVSTPTLEDEVDKSLHDDTADRDKAIADDEQAGPPAEGEPAPLETRPAATALPAAVLQDVVPLNPDEVRRQFLVQQFLSAQDAVILCRAERLGTTTKYFRLDASQTLHECLRVLFFVNEYPVLDVVHECDLGSIALVTDADRDAIRASFKPKEKPVRVAHGVPRKKSDLTDEELHALARVPCRMHLGGLCRQGDECPYWHCAFEEVPACRSFARSGQCPKGDRCSFRHDEAAICEARKRRRTEDGTSAHSSPRFGHRGGRAGGGTFGRGRGHGRGRGRFQR